MAVPKRAFKANLRAKKKQSNQNIQNTEYSRYLALKYDKNNGSLPKWKEKEYFRLRDIYEN